MPSPAFQAICSWSNLLTAARNAARGKRTKTTVSQFEFQLADRLLELQRELQQHCYTPGVYSHFYIHHPKRRKISAASFRDRIVHHALCQVIEPRFERLFIPDSYANRPGKGTHRAIDRLHYYSKQYRYVLRADIVRHFPSIDHAILLDTLAAKIPEADVQSLIQSIIASGDGVLTDEFPDTLFPTDDLLALCRPRGLPIGNLTSQFWSNVYLHPFDLFVKRQLGCRAYLRYVDDFALFSDNKQQLWQWKQAVMEALAKRRLVIHDTSAQVLPVKCGIPWLGFVVFPTHRRLKGRKVRDAQRHLKQCYHHYRSGQISFAELDAHVKGWVNHVRYADSWSIRKQVFNHVFGSYPEDRNQ